MEELAKHGITLPPNMQGLTEEQLSELNLHDEWEDECIPTGGVIENQDPIGRRNGKGQVNFRTILLSSAGCWKDTRRIRKSRARGE